MEKKVIRILGKRGRITIPYEIRTRVGFAYNDILSFTEAPDGESIIVRREKLCDNCMANRTPEETSRTLFEFLNGLSDEQQHAALFHLAKKCTHQNGGVCHA